MKRIKQKKRIPSLRAVSLSLGGFLLLLWLVFAVSLTICVAQNLFDLLAGEGEEFAEYAGRWADPGRSFPELEARTPGYLEYEMLETLDFTNTYSWRSSGLYQYEGGWGISLLRDVSIPVQTAVIFEDRNGNVIQTNGDFLSFGYITQETCQAEGLDATPDAYGWIDLSDRDDPRYETFREDYDSSFGFLSGDYLYLRITGTMDGNRMEPVGMDCITWGARSRATDQAGPTRTYTDSDGALVEEYDYSTDELMERGLLEWETIFGGTGAAGGELVTIYVVSNMTMNVYDPGDPVGPWRNPAYWAAFQQNHTALGQSDPQNVEYASLQELLDTMRQASGEESYWGSTQFWQRRMDDLIVLDKRTCRLDAAGETASELDFTMYTAFRVSPLGGAVTLLRNVYLVTALLVLLGFLILRSRIKHHLTRPLQLVNEGIDGGWTRLEFDRDMPPVWREPYELWEHYQETQNILRGNKNEIARLRTALDYAKRAEESRRQMTSGIAHELKTPLAVIHSYAEGLKEHIADEKRDRYLDVIVAESERMDAMVLEMLDLSRLEAGKVKLARDEFSLAELTRAVLEKFELAAGAKNLQITCDFPQQCTVTADEGRIAQVIENFVGNAVKYTPVNGNISVRITTRGGQTTFRIANDCAGLSEEALSRVWDTFYRADEARSGGGTGLGLAIVKSIIDLHGGTCAARNTETGVEFRFTI